MKSIPTRKYSWTCALAWFSVLFTTGCQSEFFVDQGQIESIRGVAFVIKAPHLFIKKAFNLRDASLSSAQLLQISDAMPAIAAFTEALLSNPSAAHDSTVLVKRVRALRPLMNLSPQTMLFVKTIQNWEVHPGEIKFTTDYFYTNPQGQFVNFRDNYAFVLTSVGWQFSEHPQVQAEGLLGCSKSTNGWQVCTPIKSSN